MDPISLRRCGTATLVTALACVNAMQLRSAESHAQSAPVTGAYPTKPIRLIVPFPPGGSNDIVGRFIGQKLTARLGQQTVIDNRAGADAIIGTNLAANAVPDGYTMLIVSTTYTMTPATHKKLPYDPLKSLTPIALIGTGPFIIATWPGLQVNSVKELIALAKAKPGQLHYASSSAGGATNFAGELFKLMAGVDIVHVAYKGGGPAMMDVMSGHVPVLVNTLFAVLPHVHSGRLKVLAVSSAKRTSILPDIPTIAEAGVPGYEASIWWGMLGPAGMPRDIVTKINSEIGAILRDPETVKWFTLQAADPVTATPDDFRRLIAADITKWIKVAKEAGISIQ
ncbi:MAG: tripartite tricarboxylate transporter substrate binding protein [Betaproteobacteria bacterium]|nr:tripartite tricarboxylate transporter substrate binding protein [Betaproteobacteria bacterium]